MSDMASRYPVSVDNHLKIPRTPAVARLSENEAPEDYGFPGQNENSHPDLHNAENNSIKSIERHALVDDSSFSHDHSDPYNVDYSQEAYMEHPNTKKGRQLRVQNTHVFTNNKTALDKMSTYPDTDFDGVHHSLGKDGSIADYQAVSGKMWKDKGLQHVPDHYFDTVDQLKDKWDSSIVKYPGDNLADQIIAILAGMKAIQDQLGKDDKTFQAILDKVYKGGRVNSDGTITWGQPEVWAKIPIGNLNVFSQSNPNADTIIGAIRTRGIENADIRSQ